MKLCEHCNSVGLTGRQQKFCSRTCNQKHAKLKRKNDKISANKIFSENTSLTVFQKLNNRNIKLIVVDILSYEDKCFINWHISQFKTKRTYINKEVKFVRNNSYMTRVIPCLALSIADIEKIINNLELKMKKTQRVELKLTIKKILSFRDKWINILKG